MENKKKILIADDNESILDALKMIFEENGYEVMTSLDGSAAQELKDDLPDVILLDIRLSGLDGRHICKNLKSKEKTRNIPVILISASNNIEKMVEEAGADDYIEKPFDMNELLLKIEKILM